MDAFYASIEERDHPHLKGKPLAVGGSGNRGVLTTANYEARKYGCKSAMPAFKARALCPKLIFMPIRFDVYKAESRRIRSIFARFTEHIEPLSLDEAYLDVSHLQSSGAAIAREIRKQIFEETKLTASAGIAPNKMLAKIASDWKKPDNQFEIKESEIPEFIKQLPVSKLWGVGKKMQKNLSSMNIISCNDLQKIDKFELAKRFGQWGLVLHQLSRGQDERTVSSKSERKSISSEQTFKDNIDDLATLRRHMVPMIKELKKNILTKHSNRRIRALVVKLKFADFKQTTAEQNQKNVEVASYESLLEEAWSRKKDRAIRLLGVGVRFHNQNLVEQMELL